MSEITFLQALHDALAEEMAHDPRVILLGEDIGAYGGAFKVTEGLFAQFGGQRVLDTPIAEAAIVGAAAGAAMAGLRPVAELQFIDFLSCGGFDPLVTIAAKSRYRTGVGCPMVLRGPAGAGGRGGPYHSACPEMWAVSTPGLQVVFPSTPYDAKGLLKAAIRSDDPVLFLEHKFLYRRIRGEVPEHDYVVPLGEAVQRHPGDDAVLITYGALTYTCMQAAQVLAVQGYGVRVLDLRSLVPLDTARIVAAVRACARVVVVHEHPGPGGMAGEICAIINEQAFDYLDAPIRRVTPPATPVPHAPALEDAYLPQVDDVVAMLQEVLAY